MSASDFSNALTAFSRTVETRSQTIFTNVASAAKDSITNGSSLTGSPGQPVDTGALRNSWQLEFVSPHEALISTNLVYAPGIEDGISSHGTPITFRSPVGGAHSVRLTVQNLDRIVEDETAKAVGA